MYCTYNVIFLKLIYISVKTLETILVYLYWMFYTNIFFLIENVTLQGHPTLHTALHNEQALYEDSGQHR